MLGAWHLLYGTTQLKLDTHLLLVLNLFLSELISR